MCKMRIGRAGSYIRDGLSVEIVADTMDSYKELLDRACDVFHLSASKDEMVPHIFTTSGSMIIDSGNWTLGDYLKCTKKSEAKLGIGYAKVIKFMTSYLAIFCIIILFI